MINLLGSHSLIKKSFILFLITFFCTSSLIYISAKTPLPDKRDFNFKYHVEIPNLPEGTSLVEILTPIPQSDKLQNISNMTINSNIEYSEYIDPHYGNKILKFKNLNSTPEKIDLTFEFDITRYEAISAAGDTQNTPISESELKHYLQPNVLVPIDGEVANETKDIVSDEMTAYEKIRAIYNHLNSTMRYDKSGEGWGTGDAIFACNERRGNCTDIHSLFIGMARSCGIPARFLIGFPLPADKDQGPIGGYHCWAEFYIDEQGWIPVDISEAIKHPDKFDYYFGHLDSDRVTFSIGRDIEVELESGTKTLNYFIYPYVMVNGKNYGLAKHSFSFKDKAIQKTQKKM